MRYDDWLEAPFQDAEDDAELYRWAEDNGLDAELTAYQIEALRKEYSFVEPDIND